MCCTCVLFISVYCRNFTESENNVVLTHKNVSEEWRYFCFEGLTKHITRLWSEPVVSRNYILCVVMFVRSLFLSVITEYLYIVVTCTNDLTVSNYNEKKREVF